MSHDFTRVGNMFLMDLGIHFKAHMKHEDA